MIYNDNNIKRQRREGVAVCRAAKRENGRCEFSCGGSEAVLELSGRNISKLERDLPLQRCGMMYRQRAETTKASENRW